MTKEKKQELEDKGRKIFIGHTKNLEKALGKTISILKKPDFPFRAVYVEKTEEFHYFAFSLNGRKQIGIIKILEDNIIAISPTGRKCAVDNYDSYQIKKEDPDYHKYKTKFIVGMIEDEDIPDYEL